MQCHWLVLFKDNINNEAIWAEISSQERSNEELLDDWNTDYSQEILPGPSTFNASQLSAQELAQVGEDPKFVYSKVRKHTGHRVEHFK